MFDVKSTDELNWLKLVNKFVTAPVKMNNNNFIVDRNFPMLGYVLGTMLGSNTWADM